jgi:hypothetical protein
MPRSFVVSTHIPKTGGSVLAEILSICYDRRIIMDYDGYANPIDPKPIIKDNRGFISDYFRVLHGHFYAKKYFDIFPEARFVAGVRHPVDRVIAQYFHEASNTESTEWYHKDIASGKIDIATFAAQPGIGDAMSTHLSGRKPADYSLLLVYEQFRLSLALYDKLIAPLDLVQNFGSPPALPTARFTDFQDKIAGVSKEQRAAVYDQTKPDNEIYAEAVSLLEGKVNLLK